MFVQHPSNRPSNDFDLEEGTLLDFELKNLLLLLHLLTTNQVQFQNFAAIFPYLILQGMSERILASAAPCTKHILWKFRTD